ncbi:hypothetical protein N0V90_000317 [Kalmusia sp. IMI 367209]|nr:hypothetical protein N0V90_000317 [Kalmusia sp. IMI 367209]
MAQQRPERHLKRVLQYTHGIIFLGTPHHGSGLAHWAETLAKAVGMLKQTNSKILATLRSDSEVLERIQHSFHTMIRSRGHDGLPSIEITCFFEELPLLGVGTVVPSHSATLSGYIPIGIRSNHMDMTKFKSAEDPGFIAVAGELRRWCEELSSATAENALLSPLLIAAASPSIEALERVIRTTPDVNIKEDGPLQRNALHIAAIANQPRNVSRLLRARVDIHATANGGITPIFLACMTGYTEVVRIFLEEGNQDPNVRDANQNTLLHAAAVTNRIDVTRMLLERGADPWAVEDSGWTPLNVAVTKRHDELVRVLAQAMERAGRHM